MPASLRSWMRTWAASTSSFISFCSASCTVRRLMERPLEYQARRTRASAASATGTARQHCLRCTRASPWPRRWSWSAGWRKGRIALASGISEGSLSLMRASRAASSALAALARATASITSAPAATSPIWARVARPSWPSWYHTSSRAWRSHLAARSGATGSGSPKIQQAPGRASWAAASVSPASIRASKAASSSASRRYSGRLTGGSLRLLQAALGAQDHLVDLGLIHGGLTGDAVAAVRPGAEVQQAAALAAEGAVGVLLAPHDLLAALGAGDFQGTLGVAHDSPRGFAADKAASSR